MTHVKALQAGYSSQGTSEPITPVYNVGLFRDRYDPCCAMSGGGGGRSDQGTFEPNYAHVLWPNVSWLDCPASNDITWVITVTE